MKRVFICFIIFQFSIILFSTFAFAQSDETSLKSSIKQSEVAPAQAPPKSASEKSDSEKVEKVEVTGSHIKRIDVEGASPVETVTRKDIEKTGYNSVSDVLRDMSVSAFGSTREAAGSNVAGVAQVDLRGLGASNTLVLLNGQRLPTDAVTGAVDLNLIPMAAVERIEILKDGASAVYGSDALGGVVNIITRKDFSGTQVSATQSLTEAPGGSKREISVVNGVNFNHGNTINTIQYRDNTAMMDKDRPWLSNQVSNVGNPGSYRNGQGKWIADQNCPPDQIKHTPDGDYCTFNYSNSATALPALQQFSLLSETNYEVSPNVKMLARIGGTRKSAQWSYAPSPGQFTIPAAVASHLGPGGGPLPGTTPGQDLNVNYRLAELGTRDTSIETYSYSGLLGASVDIGKGWELDINGSHNGITNSDKGVNGYALTQDIKNAIASGQYNPFAPAGQKGTLNATKYQPEENTLSYLTSAEIKASGDLKQFEAGALSLAVGTATTFQRYEDKYDAVSQSGAVFGNAGMQAGGGGQRQTIAAFSELSVPIRKNVELQLAERFDHYSDFGDTMNPKAAVLYHLSPSVLFRSSVGTGFKAPLMQDLYAAPASSYPSFIDAVACQKEQQAGGETPECSPQQYPVTSSGNTGLKEEHSISFNAGAMYQPTADFNIGSDWFLTKTSNVVGIDYSDAMRAEAQGIDLAKYGVIVNRDANGVINTVAAPSQNLSAQQISGIDLSTSYRLRKFKFGVEHSQLFYFNEEGFPGMGMRDKLGESGRPPWRNVASIIFNPTFKHDIDLTFLTTAENGKADQRLGKLATYTRVDLQWQYRTDKAGTYTVGVRNLLGTTPPIDDSDPTSPINVNLYDQIGTQAYAGYKATF